MKTMKHSAENIHWRTQNPIKTQNQEPQCIIKRPVGQEEKEFEQRQSDLSLSSQLPYNAASSLYHRCWILRAWDMNPRALGEGGILE